MRSPGVLRVLWIGNLTKHHGASCPGRGRNVGRPPMPGFVRENCKSHRLFCRRGQTKLVGESQTYSEQRKFAGYHSTEGGVLRSSAGKNHFMKHLLLWRAEVF